MFNRMLTGAVFAGCAAGLVGALLHFVFVQEQLLLGERYESGDLTHFSSGSSVDDAPVAAPVVADAAAAPAADAAAAGDGHSHAHGADAGAGHDHGPAGDEPSTLTRNALTVLFTVLIYVSYAMLLAAGFALAERMGRRISATEGVLWGLGGFATFQLAPAMGLAPELPGTIAAELGARQVWWWGTAAATATALALLAYGRSVPTAGLAVILLLAPHLIGAPVPDAFWGVAPPEVAATFAARVLGVGLAVWAVLGWGLGWFWSRTATA